jgi:hypothetical protein
MPSSDDPRVVFLKAQMHKILDDYKGITVTADNRRSITLKIERQMRSVLRRLRLHDVRCAGLPPIRASVVWDAKEANKVSIDLVFQRLDAVATQLQAAEAAGEGPQNVLRTSDGDHLNPEDILGPGRAKA